MTVIVWSSKEKLLASDSRFTDGDGGSMFLCKKLYHITLKEPERFDRHLYVGLAGDQSSLKFLRWVREGMDPSNKPDFEKSDDFTAIVVEVSNFTVRAVSHFDKTCEPEPVVEDYHAIGMGAQCAFVAMDRGALAREAVEAAILRDQHCGGPIKLMPCSG